MKLNIQMFAETRYNGTTATSSTAFYVTRTTTQDPETLTTKEIIRLYLQKKSSGVNSYAQSAPYSISKDGVVVKQGRCSFDFRGASIGTSILVASYTTTLVHDEDGAYDPYRLRAAVSTGTSMFGDCILVVNTVITPAIPVSFNVSIPNFNLEQSPVITVGVNKDTYTYNLRYSISTETTPLTGIIVTGATSTSHIWTMSDELKNDIQLHNPSTANPEVTIFCDTYSGATLKGTRQSVCKVNIGAGIVITGITNTETVANIRQYTNDTSYIRELSKINLSVGLNYSPGVTLKKIQVTVNGNTNIESTTNEVIIENITSSVNGYVSLTIHAISSRGDGETYILEQWLPFVDYTKVEYVNTECSLSRSSDIDHVSAMLKATTFIGNIGSTANTVSLSYKYRIKDSGDPYVFGITQLALNTNVQLEETFEHSKTYEVVFMIEDLIHEGSPMTKIITTTEYVMCEYENGVDFKKAWIKGKEIPTLEDDSRNMITVTTSAYATVRTGSKVPFNTTDYVKGSKLKSDDTNGVVIGKGVTEVLVSFQINGNYTGRQWFVCMKNNTNTNIGAIGKSGADGYTTLVATPKILEVAEGDVITVKSQSDGTVRLNDGMGSGDTCYMTIEDITPQLAVGGSGGDSTSGGSTSSNDYNNLYNKPLINSVLLKGNKTFEQLGAIYLTNTEIEDVINSVII